MNVNRAIRDIAIERQRQIDAEGWTPAHDDMHSGGEMVHAAACYAMEAAAHEGERDPRNPPETWPWSAQWWKPKNRRHDLVRAAALIAAEIERLDRLAMAMPELVLIGTERSPGEKMADAIDLADRLFPGKHWLFGKGRITPEEPLFGFRVFEPGNEEAHIAEGEHDDPVECVWAAAAAALALPEVPAL
ncbi:MAG: hypothetical protein E5Y74_00680 [Mesorhizobium sp.]|nr:MAG: hypothetical protein E5Y74_00680 [Mesorhizobium sp.]